MAAMLKVNDIHVYYGKIHAVKGVSFEVNEGEIVSLIGANGAGKSTILKTVSGLMHPKSGTIEFMGKDIAHMEPNKIVTKGLVHVPEGRRVFAHMSVMENIEMGAYILGKVPEEAVEDVFTRFPRNGAPAEKRILLFGQYAHAVIAHGKQRLALIAGYGYQYPF